MTSDPNLENSAERQDTGNSDNSSLIDSVDQDTYEQLIQQPESKPEEIQPGLVVVFIQPIDDEVVEGQKVRVDSVDAGDDPDVILELIGHDQEGEESFIVQKRSQIIQNARALVPPVSGEVRVGDKTALEAASEPEAQPDTPKLSAKDIIARDKKERAAYEANCRETRKWLLWLTDQGEGETPFVAWKKVLYRARLSSTPEAVRQIIFNIPEEIPFGQVRIMDKRPVALRTVKDHRGNKEIRTEIAVPQVPSTCIIYQETNQRIPNSDQIRLVGIATEKVEEDNGKSRLEFHLKFRPVAELEAFEQKRDQAYASIPERYNPTINQFVELGIFEIGDKPLIFNTRHELWDYFDQSRPSDQAIDQLSDEDRSKLFESVNGFKKMMEELKTFGHRIGQVRFVRSEDGDVRIEIAEPLKPSAVIKKPIAVAPQTPEPAPEPKPENETAKSLRAQAEAAGILATMLETPGLPEELVPQIKELSRNITKITREDIKKLREDISAAIKAKND